jgi:hypothetical protein
VTGTFAEQALEHADASANFWGGQVLTASVDPAARRVPTEITGWKRYLGEEYFRYYRGGVRLTSQPRSAPTPAATTAAAPAPTPTPPPQDGSGNNGDDGNDGNGNGRGNGNRNRR